MLNLASLSNTTRSCQKISRRGSNNKRPCNPTNCEYDSTTSTIFPYLTQQTFWFVNELFPRTRANAFNHEHTRRGEHTLCRHKRFCCLHNRVFPSNFNILFACLIQNQNKKQQALQDREERLQVLLPILRQRIRYLEEQTVRDMQQDAIAIAENQRLKRQVAKLQQRNDQARPVTPEDLADTTGTESKDKRDQSTRATTRLGPSTVAHMHRQGAAKKRKPHVSSAKSPSALRSLKRVVVNTAPGVPKGQPYYTYACPVPGCTKKLYFLGTRNPPLYSNGMVSDKVSWNTSHFYNQVYRMRLHFQEDHPYVAKKHWPAGFADREEEESRSKKDSKKKATDDAMIHRSTGCKSNSRTDDEED